MKNAQNPFLYLKGLWYKLISIGISDDLSFEEKKLTLLLNIFALSGGPSCFLFAIVNIQQNRLPLASINLAMGIGALAILLINKKRKYLTGRLVLSSLGICLFTTSSILYNNGAEYFLLLNLVATVILFQNRTYVIVVASLNALLFISIQYIHYKGVQIDHVPSPRIFFNIAWTLFFIIVALHYYKTEHLNYQEMIETSNQQLKKHQHQLLTQKKELEEKTSALEVMNQTKEKLFSVIAHDMRTPIASLKSSLDLFNNQVITAEEFKNLTAQLTGEVDNLYYNLDNLLHWSHSQLNGLKAQPVTFQLKKLALQTISLLLQNSRQKKVQILQHIPEDMFAFADPDQIKVVIRNLLSNSIKFSHLNDTIEVGAFNKGSYIEVFVKDSGVGMLENQLKDLFNEKIESKRGTQNEKGTGLGLALCKEFVEKNNGHINVYSTKGVGTTFTFTLPSVAQKSPVLF